MNGEELERLIRPLATTDTQVVVEVLDTLYDVQWVQEWVDVPVEHDISCWAKIKAGQPATFEDGRYCDGCGATNQSYYRVVLTLEVPRDPERAGTLDAKSKPLELTPAERIREHGVKTKAAPAFLSRSKDKDRR